MPLVFLKEWVEEHFPYLIDKFIATGAKEYINANVLIDDHMPFCCKYKEKNPDAIIASLEYPWTDKKLVTITGKNWFELSNKIIKEVV